MSKAEMIAKLETLLSRVRSRSNEPRPARVPLASAAAAAVAPAPEPAEDEIELVTIPPPAAEHVPPPRPAPPPAPAPSPSPPAVQVVDMDVGVEVDVLPEVAIETVIGVTTEEVTIEALDSRERLVVAEPVVGIAIESPSSETADESPPDILSAVEEVEEAPLSSRRPVAPEPGLAEMAFGNEEPRPPRHTPPPESGRLPAVPAAREFDPDETGVREAPPRPHQLVAETTHPQLAPSDAVADIVGQAARFAPHTFVALLDASLALH